MASVNRLELQPSTALTAAATNSERKSLNLFDCNFVAWMKTSAIHAATTVNAKIQHSANGTDWEDLVAFTALAGVTGFESKQITVYVLPHVRSVVALSGLTLAATTEVALYNDKSK
jgi:hypothetical protein